MIYKTPRKKPEQTGSIRLRRFMESKGWFIKKIHGSKFSKNWPDSVAFHIQYGLRWIEFKKAGGKVSQGQMQQFAIFHRYGQEVYILRDEKDYMLLFNKIGNWGDFI